MSSRIVLAGIAALVLAVVASACNKTDVRNRTIPPIAGVTVGGPTQQSETGSVGVAVDEATANVVPNSVITVRNVTTGAQTTLPVGATPTSVVIAIPGDVGDELAVTLNVSGFGVGEAHYSVPSPAITGVSSGAGDGKVVPHQQATIFGAGFCINDGFATINAIFIDGTALDGAGTVVHAMANQLVFMAPQTLSTSGSGTHTLEFTVAGAAPGNATYASGTIQFQAVPAI